MEAEASPGAFLARYADGNCRAALEALLPDERARLEGGGVEAPAGKPVWDLADALAFGELSDALQALDRFEEHADPPCQPAVQVDGLILELLTVEDRDFAEFRASSTYRSLPPEIVELVESEREGRSFAAPASGPPSSRLPPSLVRHLATLIEHSQRWVALRRARPDLLGSVDRCARPYWPLSQAVDPGRASGLRRETAGVAEQDGTPVIFMAPLRIDWEGLFRQLGGRQHVLVFPSLASLHHCVGFDPVLEAISGPSCQVWVLDRYPDSLFTQRGGAIGDRGACLTPLWISRHPLLLGHAPALLAALAACRQRLGGDAGALHRLYALGCRLRGALDAERLGRRRVFALEARQARRRGLDRHRFSAPPDGADLGPALPDPVAAALEQLSHRRVPRPLPRPSRKRRLRLAHVVAQVVDGAHAPSHLLRTLLQHRDCERFEVSLFVTEQLVMRPEEYPPVGSFSRPTSDLARETLARLREDGVPLWIDSGEGTFLAGAERLADALHDSQLDAAVFHGSDLLNRIASRITDVPLRVLFHPEGPPDPEGFDLVVVGSEEAALASREQRWPRGLRVVASPFLADCREHWSEPIWPRRRLGLPENAKLLTTISNQLDAKLSSEMCEVVARILQRCPDAVYAPMGGVTRPQELLTRFARRGVADRVHFLGPRHQPSQIARSMDLYLNEFPIGGGLEILDAMAAGCPVVSMYDREGPPQARTGGDYFGIERAVTTLDPDDYVELACRLLRDPELYRRWSRVALDRYERRTDAASSVRRFESALLGALQGARRAAASRAQSPSRWSV